MTCRSVSASVSLGLSLVCRWFVAGLSLPEIAQNHAKIAQNCDFWGFGGLNE